jgi:hypothetical protein
MKFYNRSPAPSSVTSTRSPIQIDTVRTTARNAESNIL